MQNYLNYKISLRFQQKAKLHFFFDKKEIFNKDEGLGWLLLHYLFDKHGCKETKIAKLQFIFNKKVIFNIFQYFTQIQVNVIV